MRTLAKQSRDAAFEGIKDAASGMAPLAGVAPLFNPRYLDFAHHYGFTIAPCNVARANEKGRMGPGVGFIKKNFLRGLELSEFSAIQAAAQVWLDTIAIVRIHGETRRRPVPPPLNTLCRQSA